MSHIWDRNTKIDTQIEKAGGEAGEPDPVLRPGELGQVPFPPGEIAEMRHVHPPVLDINHNNGATRARYICKVGVPDNHLLADKSNEGIFT